MNLGQTIQLRCCTVCSSESVIPSLVDCVGMSVQF